MYKWQQIKVLRSKGIGIKSIARKLKISKNTVKKYLSTRSRLILRPVSMRGCLMDIKIR